MKQFLFKTYPSSYLLKERNAVSTGPFGLSIRATCFCLIAIITVLYGCIWYYEGTVLLELFGFKLPVIIRIWSAMSTATLYFVLFKSVAMAYAMLLSCTAYFLTHSAIFVFLCNLYLRNRYKHDPLFALIYYRPNYTTFYIFMIINFIRIIITLPLMYYVLVIAVIRINGGTGGEKKAAYAIEQAKIERDIKDLHTRMVYVRGIPMEHRSETQNT